MRSLRALASRRYAFCYVAIYGYDFKKAGQSVFALFKKLGWTTIINDDLVDNALSFGSFGIGMLCGLLAYLYSEAADIGAAYTTPMVIVGICIGIGMSSVTLNVVSSAVATVFVCFAENPEAIFNTHQDEGHKLRNAWATFHGDTCNQCGYAEVGGGGGGSRMG